MFRTVPVSIIRSFSLHTQQWYMSHSLRAGSGKHSEMKTKCNDVKLQDIITILTSYNKTNYYLKFILE